MRVVFFFLGVMVPLAVEAGSSAELHEYNSPLIWEAQLEQRIDEVLNRVTRFLRPVSGRVSSHFGMRGHPLFNYRTHHRGIDIACTIGSEVRAALPGKVLTAGQAGDYGKMISIAHRGVWSESRYGHLSEFLVSPGMRVKQGQLIGLSGMSGLATGPHLHFELYRRGHPVDPERFFKVTPGRSARDEAEDH